MPNDFVNVEVDDARLKQAFATLISRGENMEPLTAEIANHLYNLTDEAFEVKSSYTGTPWARLAPSTVKAKGHSEILHREGTMRRSLYEFSDQNTAVVGTGSTYGGYSYPAVHQYGTKDGKVPARPFLPFDDNGVIYDTVVDDILLIVGDYLEL